MSLKNSHNCREELHLVDLRVTPARLGVLRVLEDAAFPLDVAAIITYLKSHAIDADPATVFRIMNSFLEKGLVMPIQLNEGKLRYEHALKANHHHFICEKCGTIEDIADCALTKIERMLQKKGFLIKRHSLEFFGLCQNCQK